MGGCDLLIHNANVATMEPTDVAYGALEAAVVAIEKDRITWVGRVEDAPPNLISEPAEEFDAGGGWVTPGLIDCHTHLVFGGNRADEFEARLAGASYEEIARDGGGILSTVRATRVATQDELLLAARTRCRTLVSHGVTTVEIKSGYGLETRTELDMLRVARTLGVEESVQVSTTLLAAHALPPEYASDRAAYLSLVCDEMIPAAASEGLADAVDVFCETIAFSSVECQKVLEAGRQHGLPGRVHADQLSDSGGAALAARMGAASADHLEYASSEGLEAMAHAGVTAVLLPGAYYYLREPQRPPVHALRKLGVPIAVATDLNPGSSPVLSPLAAMNLACVLFELTPEEALAGMTRNAASVLAMGGSRGVLAAGRQADLAIWHIDQPGELSYWLGSNPCVATVRAGRLSTH